MREPIRYIIAILIALFMGFAGHSVLGQVTVIEEAGISSLRARYYNQNRAQNRVEGYTIQILQASTRDEIFRERAKFNGLFPGVVSNISYAQPYFKLRVGGFVNKLDAYSFLFRLKNSFSRAFIVQERIALKDVQR